MFTEDKNDLERFIVAQRETAVDVFMELSHEKKETCWIWFIFPVLRGEFPSEMSQYYGLQDIWEAENYLLHPMLGMRLRMHTWLMYDASPDKSALDILGSEVDVFKFKKCMELFAPLEEQLPYSVNIFQVTYERYFTVQPRYVEWLPFWVQDIWHRIRQ